MNLLDQKIQEQFAVMAAPKGAPFKPLATEGQRCIVGCDSVKLEVRRPWIHAIVPLHESGPSAHLPYGSAPATELTLLCGKVPAAVVATFLEQARAALPNEAAAWVLWDETTREFECVALQASASSAHCTYDEPDRRTGKHLVLDLHSHGRAPAFFSSQDDEDDAAHRTGIKLAAVVGNVDAAAPSFAARACVLGATFNVGTEVFA